MSQNKKDTFAQVKHTNDKLNRMGSNVRLQVIEQAACYTYHIGIAKITKEEPKVDWYSTDSCNRSVFKTWAEALIWIQGYRQALIDTAGY